MPTKLRSKGWGEVGVESSLYICVVAEEGLINLRVRKKCNNKINSWYSENFNSLMSRGYEIPTLSVNAGSTYYARPGDIIDILRVNIHPQYNQFSYDYDAAVLTLTRRPVIGRLPITVSILIRSLYKTKL